MVPLWDPEGRPAAGRAAHYRELAAMHLDLGQNATSPEAQAGHLELAALWTRLAAQAEQPSAEANPSP